MPWGDDDSWRDGYDEWKTRLPDWWDPPEEDEFYCYACLDVGWLTFGDEDIVIPCTECSSEADDTDIEYWMEEENAADQHR